MLTGARSKSALGSLDWAVSCLTPDSADRERWHAGFQCPWIPVAMDWDCGAVGWSKLREGSANQKTTIYKTEASIGMESCQRLGWPLQLPWLVGEPGASCALRIVADTTRDVYTGVSREKQIGELKQQRTLSSVCCLLQQVNRSQETESEFTRSVKGSCLGNSY